jgi:3-hydroxy-3-methylglutaryl CoA synthase
MEHGITSIGVYVPRYRLARGAIAAAHRWMAPSLAGAAKGARAFCSWDEDAITMAVEAGRDCLRGVDASSIEAIALASTTLPYSDLQNSVIVAAGLGLSSGIATTDAAGGQRAATSALIAALSGRRGPTLLIASDKPHAKPASVQELLYGAGAAAVSIGAGDVMARLLGHASVAAYFVDHFRSAEAESDYFWEERWIRDEGYAKIAPRAVEAALGDAGVAIGEVKHFVMPSLLRGASQAVAKAVGFGGTVADSLDAECGYTGAAHALLMLNAVLAAAEAGDKILLVGFGQGADALVLEATGRRIDHPAWRGVGKAIADRYLTSDYLRMLSFQGDIDLEWGMRAEKTGKAALTEAYRNDRQLSNFRAGRCRACGTIQFPQLAYCVNCKAPGNQFESVSLADEPARILTFTADWLSYHPAPPLFVGFVQFDNGARLLMETVDAPPEAIDVGVRLRMAFRIKERDSIRGFNRYFWKSTPIQI